MKKTIAFAAACATALTPILATPSMAAATLIDAVPTANGPSGDALADMALMCSDLADDYDTGNGDVWTGEVQLGTPVLVSGPTEVGTRSIDESTIEHDPNSDYVPATTEIRGDPFRIGGSVNLFGDQYSTAGYWTNHFYEFDADYETTFSYPYSCKIYQAVYVPEQVIEHRAVGVYVFNDDGTGSDEDAIRANCEQYKDNGQPWWGDPFRPNPDNPRCKFEGTPAYTEVIPEDLLDPVLIDTVPQIAIEETQTDNLRAFEDEGGRLDVEGEFHIGQVVVCISPSSTGKKGNPGEWRPQNGYSGELCNTDHFKVAEWGSGTEDSNGTYISVPNYLP